MADLNRCVHHGRKCLCRLVLCVAGVFLPGQHAARATTIDPDIELEALILMASERTAAELEDESPRWHFALTAEELRTATGTYGRLYGPSVASVDLEALVGRLGLSGDQADAVRTVYRQRLENFLAASRELLRCSQELTAAVVRSRYGGTPPDVRLWMSFDVAASAVVAEQRAMRLGVLEDLKSLLEQGQLTRWQVVEAWFRRVRFMRSASVSLSVGIRVDPRVVVETILRKPEFSSVQRDVRDRIDELLREYDSAADVIFSTFERLADQLEDVLVAKRDAPERSEVQTRVHRQSLKLIERLRGLNDQVVRDLAATVSETAGFQINREYLVQAFPEVYGRTHGQTVLITARGLPDLSPQQLASLESIELEWLPRCELLRGRVVSWTLTLAKLSAEMADDDEAIARAAAAQLTQFTTSPDPARELAAMDFELVRRVRAVLSDEQRANLPRRPRSALLPAIDPGYR